MRIRGSRRTSESSRVGTIRAGQLANHKEVTERRSELCRNGAWQLWSPTGACAAEIFDEAHAATTAAVT